MKNFVNVYFSQIFGTGSAAFTTLLLIIFIPPSEYLRLVQLMAIGQALTLILGAGIENYIVKNFSKRNNVKKRDVIYSSSLVAFLTFGLLISILNASNLNQSWSVLLAVLLYSYVTHVFNSYLCYLNTYRLYERYKKTIMKVSAKKFIATAALIVPYKVFDQVDFPFLFLLSLSMCIITHLKLSRMELRVQVVLGFLKGIKKFFILFAFLSFGDLSIAHADKIILPIFFESDLVGNYLKIIQIITLPLNLIASSLIVIIAPKIYGDNIFGVRLLYERLGLNITLESFIYISILTSFILPVLLWAVLGTSFMFIILLCMVVASLLFLLVFNLDATQLINVDRLDLLLVAKIALAFICLCLPILLIPVFGLYAVVISNMVGISVATGLIHFFVGGVNENKN